MTAISVFCPVSGRPIDCGIETDPNTFLTVQTLHMHVRCSECGQMHKVQLREGYLQLGRSEAAPFCDPIDDNPSIDRLVDCIGRRNASLQVSGGS